METPFSPFPVLLTERLVLRALVESDEYEIYQQRSDPRILEHIDIQVARSLDDARQFIQKISLTVQEKTGIYWAIALRDNPLLIGTICLWNFSHLPASAEIGYSLHPDFQGKGYMQEALNAVMEFSFRNMHASTLEAFTNPENAPSIRLLTRNGFIQEGTQDGLLRFVQRQESFAAI